MPTIYYKQNGTSYYKVVEDGANSATFEIVANDNYFEAMKKVDTDVSTYDDLDEADFFALLDSFADAVTEINEFVGGHPPHFPIPTRPK